VREICFYHAGCPDGFGAAWAAWRSLGDDARYIARRHEDTLCADDYEGDWVLYLDIAPGNEELLAIGEAAERVTILDHHVSARERYHSDLDVVRRMEDLGHEIVYDMTHSGAVLAWNYFFSAHEPTPELLRYVEDQDLWSWQLPRSEQVNAAIAAYPRRFAIWSQLADRSADELANEGEPIVRANRMQVERSLRDAHPLQLDGRQVEAVNASHARSAVGHELAKRQAFGHPWGCVYRLSGNRVHATLYSIGDLDVSTVAGRYGGGGHRNAAGFNVDLARWIEDFLPPGASSPDAD
jgi:hypothetical protein